MCNLGKQTKRKRANISILGRLATEVKSVVMGRTEITEHFLYVIVTGKHSIGSINFNFVSGKWKGKQSKRQGVFHKSFHYNGVADDQLVKAS